MTRFLAALRRKVYRACLHQTYAEYDGMVGSIPAVAYRPSTAEDKQTRWAPTHENVLACAEWPCEHYR